MKKKRILIVDDEVSIRRFVGNCLREHGFDVSVANNGEEALAMAEKENPDLVVLDVMMPRMDGLEACRRLREWATMPIIMLSARADEEDIVACLDAGADDYITKPFGVEELLARVRAVFRRTEPAPGIPDTPVLNLGDIEISFAERQVRRRGVEVKLTPTEYQLLYELGLQAGKVLTHAYLLSKVWGPEYREETAYVHELVRRLRNKLERDNRDPQHIITIAGVGYTLRKSAAG